MWGGETSVEDTLPRRETRGSGLESAANGGVEREIK